MRVFSFGGGVQSTAALILAAQGELEVDAFLFANVGDDSENPATLRYVRDVAMPYAERNGITLHELRRIRRDGSTETLYGRLTKGSSKSIGIPVRLSESGAPARRNCTTDFKIRLIASWCYRHGARPTKPALTMLGISFDERIRARSDSGFSYTRLGYPFLNQIGRDKHEFLPEVMNRQDCMNVIARAGLPIPPKSSCWFCPFHSLRVWQEMRDKEPELFAKACDLEDMLSARSKTLWRSNPKYRPEDQAVYFTGRLIPLRKAVGHASQASLFSDDTCESGYCMV